MDSLSWLIIGGGGIAIVYAILASSSVFSAPAGNDAMKKIAAAIQEGASAYLNRQYSTIGVVGAVIALLLWIYMSAYVAFGFVIGAVLSGCANKEVV